MVVKGGTARVRSNIMYKVRDRAGLDGRGGGGSGTDSSIGWKEEGISLTMTNKVLELLYRRHCEK